VLVEGPAGASLVRDAVTLLVALTAVSPIHYRPIIFLACLFRSTWVLVFPLTLLLDILTDVCFEHTIWFVVDYIVLNGLV